MKNQSGELKRWREIAPLVYREIDGLERLAFRRDASGRCREMLPFPAIYEGQRVPWYASKIFIGLLIGGSLLARAPHCVAVASRVIIANDISGPLFSTKSDRCSIFSFTNCLPRRSGFQFSRQSLRLARDWSTS
jgi:hypothetical protein